MWSDVETSEDLLGHKVHASLIQNVITNEKNLPITVGLYGDWGSGKSSVLRILEEKLKEDDNSIVIYFDGWSFESFDDAKMALIQGIVEELESNEKFINKIKSGAKEQFDKLRKSINWMRVLKVTSKTAMPIVANLATGGAAAIIPTLLNVFNSNKDNLKDLLTGEGAEKFLNGVLKDDNDKEKYKAVREFKKDFEKLIDNCEAKSIVVLIDDLDRCLPRHIIDNLEAIKLFLNVKKTAFVIAADQYIVSNAIKSEYKSLIEISNEDRSRPELGDLYMEKFIQLPYKIPALSNKEVETYVTLLFCKSLLPIDVFEHIITDFNSFSKDYKFEKYGWGNIITILKDTEEYADLKATVEFITQFASVISTSLRRNPRLIKRFLNAYEIRNNLLSESGLNCQNNKFALLKLMLVEQMFQEQFKELYGWVMSSNSEVAPAELRAIEEFAIGDRTKDLEHSNWNNSQLLDILSAQPKFSDINMKELFWVSRDNIVDAMGGSSLIPPRIRGLFTEIYKSSSDNILKENCRKKIKQLESNDLDDFYKLLEDALRSDSSKKQCYNIYYFCIIENINMSYAKLFSALKTIDVNNIPFSLGNKFKDIISNHGNEGELISLLSSNNKLMQTINSAK